MSSTYTNNFKKACFKYINYKRENNNQNNTLEKCKKSCSNKGDDCNGIVYFESINSKFNPTGYHCTTYKCQSLRDTNVPTYWGDFNYYVKEDLDDQCKNYFYCLEGPNGRCVDN